MPPTPLDRLLSSYDYTLPQEAIAQRPLAARDAGRLLVARNDGGPPEHRRMVDLPQLLEPDDLLVLNNTRVRPARLTARRPGGGAVRILLLDLQSDGSFTCLLKPSSRIPDGARLRLVRRGASEEEAGPCLIVRGARGGPNRSLHAEDGALLSLLDVWGEMPLPPYIDRDAGPEEQDRERYQTVFAAHDGAVAAPTAGLHFTDALFSALDRRGVRRCWVTLHVGAGTFSPIRDEDLTRHAMHPEQWLLPPSTARAIDAARARGSRIVAVGTTAMRTLETWHRLGEPHDGSVRTSELFLHPFDPPRFSCSLLTNFHLPRSSLLILVASILGRERTLALYETAKASGYRFTSYGDASLLL